jgi:hypothetical protein
MKITFHQTENENDTKTGNEEKEEGLHVARAGNIIFFNILNSCTC